MKNRGALVLAAGLFGLVLAMCLYSVPRLAAEASAYFEAEMLVVIDAGHGGEDGGASTADGVLEKTLNLEISQRICDLLRLLGARVQMLRETDTALYSEGCSGIAEKKVSDLKNRVKRTNEMRERYCSACTRIFLQNRNIAARRCFMQRRTEAAVWRRGFRRRCGRRLTRAITGR